MDCRKVGLAGILDIQPDFFKVLWDVIQEAFQSHTGHRSGIMADFKEPAFRTEENVCLKRTESGVCNLKHLPQSIDPVGPQAVLKIVFLHQAGVGSLPQVVIVLFLDVYPSVQGQRRFNAFEICM